MNEVDYMYRAVSLSRLALSNDKLTPFGAVLVVNGEIAGEGISQVVASHDPTAHAEMMALRSAGAKLKTHLFPTATMYCSSEPCPMCFSACLWAQVPRVVYATSTLDVAIHGFEDMLFYRDVASPDDAEFISKMCIGGDSELEALAILEAWAKTVPGGVVPKL
jgi:tRNA(Arg) A34 adenosine deaminase TadA